MFLLLLLSLFWTESQAVVSYHVPKAQIQFLDELCQSVQCHTNPKFRNWDFAKSNAGDYLVSPCQALPTDQNDPQRFNLWPFVSCTYESPLLLGQTSATANVTTLLQGYPTTASKLSGTIPASISGMVALKVLQINGQHLSGTLPVGIGRCTALETIDLAENRLSGGIPGAELVKLLRLTQLVLTGNLFSGPIASELTAMTKLTVLNLVDNKLSGAIPSGLSALTALTALQLGENMLSGEIPASIYTMSRLLTLDIDNNQLSGQLSPSLASLYNLRKLEASNNRFSGAIPAAIYSMTNLTTLDIGHNSLSGGLSSSIGQMTKLQELTLGANNLGGPLPAELSKLTALVIFDYAYNGLTGGVPTMFNSSVLQVLELGGNAFGGNIPDAVYYQSLTKLSLENCQLSGGISPAIANMQQLTTLYLDENSLSGTVPNEMRKMANLAILSLNNNKLTGAFALCDLGETIQSISISGNPFICYNPCWDGEAALTPEYPSCNFCPKAYYTGQVLINDRNSAEGTMNMCIKCPEGSYNLLYGVTGVNSCLPCPHQLNPTGAIIGQCSQLTFQGRNVKLGGATFNVIAYLFSFSTAGLLAFFAVFVYRARNNCALTVRIHFLVIVIKMASYGFIIFSDFILSIALLTSFVYDKFGAIILLLRLSHVLISLCVLMKAYKMEPATEKDILPMIEEGSKVTKEPRRLIPPNTLGNLIDQEGISDSKTSSIFIGMAMLCLFDSQLLQFMPWRYTRMCADYQGFPDSNTYLTLGVWKFLQSCMTMICMMNYLGGVSDTVTDSAGIDGMFALNISVTTGLLLFSILVEPVVCNLKATSEALTIEVANAEAQALESAAKRAAVGAAHHRNSVLVDAASVYGGGGDDDMVEMSMEGTNPMQMEEASASKAKPSSRTSSDSKVDKADKTEKSEKISSHHHHSSSSKDKGGESPKKAPPAPAAPLSPAPKAAPPGPPKAAAPPVAPKSAPAAAPAPAVAKKFTPPSRPVPTPGGPGAPPPTGIPAAAPPPGAPPPPSRPGPPPPTR